MGATRASWVIILPRGVVKQVPREYETHKDKMKVYNDKVRTIIKDLEASFLKSNWTKIDQALVYGFMGLTKGLIDLIVYLDNNNIKLIINISLYII